MQGEDLASLAAELRKEGFDARNLGRIGITIWKDGRGEFYPLWELNEHYSLVAKRNFEAIHIQAGQRMSCAVREFQEAP